MTAEEAAKVVRDAEQFLRNEIELNGPIYITPDRAPTPSASGAQAHVPQSPAEPRPVTRPTVESNLFGNSGESIGRSSAPQAYPDEPWTTATSLDALNAAICTCMKCGLGATRKNFVFGVGNPRADVVLIGEAPGADEDEKGEPFVGRAGQLLNKIIESISFRREEVFICNILKCRPPNNREPAADEVGFCEPYLWKQLELLQPKLILCLGRVAGQALLKSSASLTNLRGTWHEYRGIPTMVTYHPAALLRNPNWKRPAWEDVKAFRTRYDSLRTNG